MRHRSLPRFTASVALFAASAILAAATAAPQDGRGPGTGRTPPLGRPPEGVLSRSNPKTYEVTWDVLIAGRISRTEPAPLQFGNGAFFFPVLPLSTWSRSDLDAMRVSLTRNTSPDPQAAAAAKLDRSLPDGTGLLMLPLGTVASQSLRCTLVQTVTVWRSDLDDAAAVKIPWPSEWPDEARAWLGPDWFIESNDPRFTAFVERVSGGRLRHTPVFVAAKELIRATIGVFRGVEGDGVDVGELNRVRGLRISGAAASMQAEQGTAADLVCACVAVLRAAGIPARPVIGVNEVDPQKERRAVRTTYVVWGEFFLPGAGWVPFDPAVMRGTHAMNATADRAWTGLGRIKDLNERVPLSYSFRPRRGDARILASPGGWGWTPNYASPVLNGPDAYVSFQMVSRPAGPAGPGGPS